MTIEANKDLVKRTWQTMLGGNVEGALANFSDDVTWFITGKLEGVSGVKKGKQAVRAFLDSVMQAFPGGLKTEINKAYGEGDTVITADWSLDVLPDGSLRPFKPDAIELRDGELVRPVCPFIEIWARLGEAGSEASTWRDVPLTETLLGSFNANRAAITFRIDARNSKAARRAQDNNLAYGLFPSISIRGDQHAPVPLLAGDEPGADAAAGDLVFINSISSLR